MSPERPERPKRFAQQALAEAVQTHRPKLLSVIRKRVRDQVEAEDVLQEVFAEVLQTYDLGQAIETLSAWLVQVAKNKIVDRFRRNRTRREFEEAAPGESEAPPRTPDQEWARSLLREELIEAIGRLPEEQRLVFVAHELEGKSFEEISRETGVGVNTLLSRKRYAVQSLRQYLKEVYDELGVE